MRLRKKSCLKSLNDLKLLSEAQLENLKLDEKNDNVEVKNNFEMLDKGEDQGVNEDTYFESNKGKTEVKRCQLIAFKLYF